MGARYSGNNNRRKGPIDRRIAQQEPVKKNSRGWNAGQNLYYRRVDPITGKTTLVLDSRIGPKDRRGQ